MPLPPCVLHNLTSNFIQTWRSGAEPDCLSRFVQSSPHKPDHRISFVESKKLRYLRSVKKAIRGGKRPVLSRLPVPKFQGLLTQHEIGDDEQDNHGRIQNGQRQEIPPQIGIVNSSHRSTPPRRCPPRGRRCGGGPSCGHRLSLSIRDRRPVERLCSLSSRRLPAGSRFLLTCDFPARTLRQGRISSEQKIPPSGRTTNPRQGRGHAHYTPALHHPDRLY